MSRGEDKRRQGRIKGKGVKRNITRNFEMSEGSFDVYIFDVIYIMYMSLYIVFSWGCGMDPMEREKIDKQTSIAYCRWHDLGKNGT